MAKLADLETDPSDLRMQVQVRRVTAKITTIWRPTKGVLKEAELVNAPNGISVKIRSLEEDDTPVSIARWAVEEANEFLIDSMSAKPMTFDIRLGADGMYKVSFVLYPDSDGGTSEVAIVAQLLQQNETREALFYEMTRGMLGQQADMIAKLAQSHAAYAEATSRSIADQLKIVQMNAELADTRIQRELAYRTEARREERLDNVSSKFLGLVDGVAGVGGQYLAGRMQKELEKANAVDQLLGLCDPDEKAALELILSRIQARTGSAPPTGEPAPSTPSAPSTA